MNHIQVFSYVRELDCLKVTEEYLRAAQEYELVEWSPVVWLGRLFTLDEDYGEHWFDNWDEREKAQDEAERLGYNTEELYFINPKRFVGGKDGPCHTDEVRKLFWLDVLTSFRISHALMAAERDRNGASLRPHG